MNGSPGLANGPDNWLVQPLVQPTSWSHAAPYRWPWSSWCASTRITGRHCQSWSKPWRSRC